VYRRIRLEIFQPFFIDAYVSSSNGASSFFSSPSVMIYLLHLICAYGDIRSDDMYASIVNVTNVAFILIFLLYLASYVRAIDREYKDG